MLDLDAKMCTYHSKAMFLEPLHRLSAEDTAMRGADVVPVSSHIYAIR